MRRLTLAAALLVGAAGPTLGQASSPTPDGARLTVYLVTMGPGEAVWERFGHNAIWIHDPDRGTDETYNYGLFDFGQEHFVLRFIQGRMWYWMAGFPAERYFQQYVRDNRSVWIQELEMAPAARLELQRFLEWNALPEHRFYHYDYYRDNCSTRVRDALDRALGGRIRARTAGLPSGTTYRFHTQRLTANDAAVFTGLLLALGPAVDRPISAWDEAFLPMALRDHVRAVTVTGAEGRAVPLVRSERTYFTSSAPDPPPAPPAWTLRYLALGILVGGVAYFLGRRAGQLRGGRVALGLVTGGWGVLAGTVGIVLAGLWGFTDHAFAYRNENLFQANPLALLLPLLVPGWVSGRSRATRWLPAVAAGLAGVAVLGWLLQVLPGIDQVNGPIIAFMLPAHLGVTGGLLAAGPAGDGRRER